MSNIDLKSLAPALAVGLSGLVGYAKGIGDWVYEVPVQRGILPTLAASAASGALAGLLVDRSFKKALLHAAIASGLHGALYGLAYLGLQLNPTAK